MATSTTTDLESAVLQAAQLGIAKSIQENLTGYNNPMALLVKQVIESNSTELKTLINDSFQTAIRTDDFKRAILDAFSHKIARLVISNNDGLVEKVANELKQDSVFKAKMALAVSQVVNECLATRKES